MKDTVTSCAAPTSPALAQAADNTRKNEPVIAFAQCTVLTSASPREESKDEFRIGLVGFSAAQIALRIKTQHDAGSRCQ